MSGGYFEYKQYQVNQLACEVEEVATQCADEYPGEIIQQFEIGATALKVAYIYAQRIDLLLSGDDSEESFARRLKEDLAKVTL